MMGSMMGSGSSWVPVLVTMIALVAVLAVVALVVAGITRSAGRAGGGSGKPGRPAPATADRQPAEPEDRLAVLRERYARGEISHADFLHDLDAVLRAEQEPVTAHVSRPLR